MQRPTRPAVSGGKTYYFRTCLHNTIHRVLQNRPNWVETDSDVDFDFVWADKQWMADHFDGLRLQDNQRVNHFRNHYELTRKDLLVKNLKRIKKQLEKEDRVAEAAKYDFFPQSYVLPSEYMMFENAYISQPGLTWIAKPTARAQGKGIFLINDLRDVKDWKKANLPVKKKEPDPFAKPKKVKPVKEGEELLPDGTPAAGADQKKELEPYIVQRYLEDPYLVGSKKFDMRIYVLVTSYSPLTVWLYRSGFARFSGVRYSVDEKSLAAHATNVAVQKTAAGYDPETGCKWMLHSLKAFLISRHGYEAATNVFYEIQMLILRSLLAVQRAMMNDKHCVEMYGYDILLDSALKPWLIEVNASPSLTSDTVSDEQLKLGLLEDVMDVIDHEGRRQGDEERVGGFDLIYLNGPVQVDRQGNYVCYLGCHNNRVRNRRKMLRKAAVTAQSSA